MLDLPKKGIIWSFTVGLLWFIFCGVFLRGRGKVFYCVFWFFAGMGGLWCALVFCGFCGFFWVHFCFLTCIICHYAFNNNTV